MFVLFGLGSDFCVCFWDGGCLGWVSSARAGLLGIWGPGRGWGRVLVGRGMFGAPGGFVVGRLGASLVMSLRASFCAVLFPTRCLR